MTTVVSSRDGRVGTLVTIVDGIIFAMVLEDRGEGRFGFGEQTFDPAETTVFPCKESRQ